MPDIYTQETDPATGKVTWILQREVESPVTNGTRSQTRRPSSHRASRGGHYPPIPSSTPPRSQPYRQVYGGHQSGARFVGTGETGQSSNAPKVRETAPHGERRPSARTDPSETSDPYYSACPDRSFPQRSRWSRVTTDSGKHGKYPERSGNVACDQAALEYASDASGSDVRQDYDEEYLGRGSLYEADMAAEGRRREERAKIQIYEPEPGDYGDDGWN